MEDRRPKEGLVASQPDASAAGSFEHADISLADQGSAAAPTGSAEISTPHSSETSEGWHAEISCGSNGLSSAAAPTPAKSPFEPGSTLLNRFRLLRYIARGGMGEVYQVEDEITGRTMALKTVLPAVARDRQMIEQLKQEINNARDVTHRNVCRVFEVFEDPSTSPPGYFLTMEFLPGETLADVIHRQGPMSPDKLMPIAKQMAAGLEAVHEAGIVHQDFKTSNVMLVSASDDRRVVVTDFGLAVNLRAKGSSGLSGGTPAYMAPEQVEATSPIDKRADIYAFGVVLYELLTGHFPIEGKSVGEVMHRKLREAAVPPSKHCPKIPVHWEKTILRCLERDPVLRYSNLTEVLDALEQRAEKRRRRNTMMGTAAIALAAIAGIGGAGARRYLMTHRTPTVAVAGIVNRGDPTHEWLATELTEALSANLADSNDLKTVPPEDVALVKGEFPQLAGASLERENLSGLRQALGTDYLVLGHYDLSDGAEPQLSFELKLQGTNGETVGRLIHEQGPESDYQTLVRHAANELRHSLGSTLLSEAEAEEAANMFPKDAEARHLYFQALSKMHSLNGVEALDLLRNAAKREEKNVAVHVAEAESLLLQKRYGEARVEARQAQELAQGAQIPSEYVMLVEARADQLRNDWSGSIQRLDALYHLSRDKLRYGLLLANAQAHAMRPEDSLRTLAEMARLPTPGGDDPRIAISQAAAYSIAGDYQNEIQAAHRALSSARSRNWRLMEAWADLELCWAQQRIQSKDAIVSCQEAQRIFANAGDPVNAAVVLNNVANWEVTRGNLSQARDAYEAVLQITTKADDQVDSAGAHLNLAATLLQLNDLPGAREHLDAALQCASATNDSYDEARARLILADVDRATVGIQEAINEVERSQAIAHEIGDRDTEGYAWTNLILYRRDAGDLPGALKAGEQAIAIRKQLDDRAGLAAAQEFVADVYFEKGDLSLARQLYKQAIAARDASQKPKLAQLALSLAQVDFEAGDLESAVNKATDAASEYRSEKDGDSEADALALLARIKVAQKQLSEAERLLAQIEALNPQDQEVQANIAMARASWLMATGRATEAIVLLTAHAAKDNEMTYSALDKRLMLARAQLAAKQNDAAAADFAKVRNSAAKAGFRLLGERAQRSGSR